jgi:hypothetical protein
MWKHPHSSCVGRALTHAGKADKQKMTRRAPDLIARSKHSPMDLTLLPPYPGPRPNVAQVTHPRRGPFRSKNNILSHCSQSQYRQAIPSSPQLLASPTPLKAMLPAPPCGIPQLRPSLAGPRIPGPGQTPYRATPQTQLPLAIPYIANTL